MTGLEDEMMKTSVVLGALALLLLPCAAVAQTEQVRLIGEVRVRGEAERPAGLDTVDAFTLLRSRIGLEAQLSPRAVLMLQLQDARTFGEEASLTGGVAPRLDMYQAWLQYRFDAGAYEVAVRAGRQELVLGNERLVGAGGWTNTGRAFNGVRVTVGPARDGWQLSALGATVMERGRRLTGAASDMGDHLFVGAYLAAGDIDLFLLHDRESTYRTFTGVDRTAAGARLVRTFGALETSLEGVFQFGNQFVPAPALSQDIRAYMAGARLTYAMPAAVLSSIGLGVDWLSGDSDPADASYRAFNTMYASGHKWHGYLDLFLDPAGRTHDRGLVDAMASARVALPHELELEVDAHGFWLQQQFADVADRFIGWELDFTLPVPLGPGQRLQLGYSAFRAGAVAPLVGLGESGTVWHWAYIQAAFSFGRVQPIM
jgi:hypothetical protein